MPQTQHRREARTSRSSAVDKGRSPCCSAPVTCKSRPWHEFETVSTVEQGRVLETDIQLRRQGGLCTECGEPLVREAALGDAWRNWRHEEWPPDA